MELYEALKGGSSIEELKAAFQKELDAATAKIEKEKKAEQEKKVREAVLDKAREKAATAYVNYVKVLFEDDQLNYTIEDAIKTFKSTEKNMKNWKRFDATFTEDDIIRDFLRMLK